MSQENKGEDPKNKGDDPIETDIQDCRNRITKLEGDLDAARQKSPINEAYIKFLNEELPKLHERLGKLRDKQAGAGVGRSPQSSLLGRTRPSEDTTAPFRPTSKLYYPVCLLQPESNGELPLNLDAQIELIPCGFTPPVPPALTVKQMSVVRWDCTAFDFSLSNAVINLLRNRINGDLHHERAFHSRNDHFFDIIRIVAATGTTYSMMDITRDPTTSSSRTGPDATICEPGYPELVVVKEQAVDGVGAEKELCDNFVFLSQYARLTRIVGIAIIGNQFKIGFIHRDPKRFEVLMDLTTGEDGNGYTLVRAAVNIGLWFRATMHRGLLLASPCGDAALTASRHLSIRMKRGLYQHEDTNLDALSEFYKSIRSQPIPYFEYPVKDEDKTDSVNLVAGEALELVMKPGGSARQPQSSDELKDCLVCILTALQHLHGRGYVHLDLRWPNVVFVTSEMWCVIGGEYVRKVGNRYPPNFLVRDVVRTSDFACDLVLLGRMLRVLDDRSLLTSKVKALIEYLTKGERSERSAVGALEIVQGW